MSAKRLTTALLTAAALTAAAGPAAQAASAAAPYRPACTPRVGCQWNCVSQAHRYCPQQRPTLMTRAHTTNGNRQKLPKVPSVTAMPLQVTPHHGCGRAAGAGAAC